MTCRNTRMRSRAGAPFQFQQVCRRLPAEFHSTNETNLEDNGQIFVKFAANRSRRYGPLPSGIRTARAATR